MAVIELKKDKIVVADMELGMGLVDQPRGVDQEQINGNHIPYDASTSLTEEVDTKDTVVDVNTKLATKETLGGDPSTPFKAADGVAPDDVTTKAQLDALEALGYTKAEIDAFLLLKANLANVMRLDGGTPDPDYVTATRQVPANVGYVLDTVVSIGTGDMAKSIYDVNDNGRVDTADGIGVSTDAMGVTPYTQFMRLSQGTLLDCNLLDNFGIFVGVDPLNAPTSGAIGIEQLAIQGSKAQRAYSFVTFAWYDRVYDLGSNTWSAWNEWATKAYVDSENVAQDLVIDDNVAEIATKLAKAGDSMTGHLVMEYGAELHGEPLDASATRTMVKINTTGEVEFGDASATSRGLGNWAFGGNPPVIDLPPTATSHATRKDYVDKGAIPINGVIMYDGLVSAIPSNFQLMALDNVVMVATTTEAEFGTTGGSNDAVAIEHTHLFTGVALPSHTHTHTYSSAGHILGGSVSVSNVQDTGATRATSSVSGGTPTGTISTDGAVGTNLNMQAYVKMGYIKRIS